MKKILLCLSLSASLSCISQPGAEIVIRQLLDEQTIAWNRSDMEGFMQGYWQNDSLMFIGKSGITYGWTNTLNNYKKGYPDTASTGKLAFDIISIKPLSAEYAYVTGKWHLKRSLGDLSGYFTLLFRKLKDKWVIIADHSS